MSGCMLIHVYTNMIKTAVSVVSVLVCVGCVCYYFCCMMVVCMEEREEGGERGG